MKRTIRKYPTGGVSDIGMIAGNYLTASAKEEDEEINVGKQALGTGLQLGSAGLAVGGPIGGAIGLTAGTIIGVAQADKANRRLKLRRKREALAEQQRDDVYSKAVLENYDTEGEAGDIGYYKYGGVRQLASNAVQAEGPTHEQGGIDIGRIEVEDNEVGVTAADKQIWFSDRLKTAKGTTFADEAAALMEAKGKAEMLAQGGSRLRRNVAVRNIEKADYHTAKLAREQRELQEKMGISTNGVKAAYGMIDELDGDPNNPLTQKPLTEDPNGTSFIDDSLDLGAGINLTGGDSFNSAWTPSGLDPEQVAANKQARIAERNEKIRTGVQTAGNILTPMIDNVVNAALTRNAPEVPTPRMYQATSLDTRFSINAPLAEIRRNRRTTAETIRRNTSNSAIARNNIIAADLATIGATNALYTNKENVETQLRNANLANAQEVNNKNIEQVNAYRTNRFHRADDIQQRYSQNVANLVNDITTLKRDSKQEKMDAASLYLIKQRYAESGVYGRNVDEAFEDLIANKITIEEFQKRITKK